MANMNVHWVAIDENFIVHACKVFRKRLEGIIVVEGGYIKCRICEST